MHTQNRQLCIVHSCDFGTRLDISCRHSLMGRCIITNANHLSTDESRPSCCGSPADALPYPQRPPPSPRLGSMVRPLDALDVNSLLDHLPQRAHLSQSLDVLDAHLYGIIHLRTRAPHRNGMPQERAGVGDQA